MKEKILWIDLETTGREPMEDKICEISMVVTSLDNIQESVYHKYINPDKQSHPEALAKHGLTEEFLKSYKSFKEEATEIYNFLKDYTYIAGYNILNYDIPLLIEEFSRCGIDWDFKVHKYIDIYKMLVEHESRKLEEVYKRFVGKEMQNSHSSTDDVIATIELFPIFINKFDIQDISKEIVEYPSDMIDIKNNLYINKEDDYCLGFGKYKDKPIIEVLSNDPNYIKWVIDKADKISESVRNVLKQMYLIYQESK